MQQLGYLALAMPTSDIEVLPDMDTDDVVASFGALQGWSQDQVKHFSTIILVFVKLSSISAASCGHILEVDEISIFKKIQVVYFKCKDTCTIGSSI